MMDNNEVPKYIKRSNKTVKKSKHKHEYKSCLLKLKNRINITNKYSYHRAQYCVICGKINYVYFFDTEPCENGLTRMLSSEEMLNKYKDLEIFEINDIFDKYVSIVTEN